MAAVDFSNVTITNTSIRSNTIIGPGENFTITFTCKNNSSSTSQWGWDKLYSISVMLVDNGTSYIASTYMEVNASNLDTGQTKSFSVNGKTLAANESVSGYTNLFNYLNSNNIRSTNNTLSVYFIANSQVGGVLAQDTVSPSVVMKAIDKRKNPKIEKLSFKRCTNGGVADNEGTKLLSTIKTGFASNSYYNTFTFTLRMGSSTITKTDQSSLSSLLSGITDNASFANSFTVAIDSNYTLVATLSDNYETTTQQFSVPKSFVNVHLSSARNGGVSLGGYSSSDNSHPKFECNYPAYFYQGLETRYSIVTTNGSFTSNSGNIVATNGYVQAGGKLIAGTDITAGGKITADGNISAGGSLSSTGNTTVGGNLSVTGTTSLDGIVNINDRINGTTVINGATYLGGPSDNTGNDNNIVVIGPLRIRRASPNFRGGIVDGGNLAAGSNIEFTIYYGSSTFNYKNTPYVVACLYTDVANNNLSKFACYITSIGTNLFSVHVYNTGSDPHTYKISWMAFGLVD